MGKCVVFSSAGQTFSGAMPGDQSFKDGDWNCPSCGDHQFARNVLCRRCGTARPGGEAGAPEPAGDVLLQVGAPLEFKNGDWNCSKCGDHQFARNAACRRCGNPRDVAAPAHLPPREAATEDFKEGDWICAECGDHQFARNAVCRRCHAARPITSSNHQTPKPGDWICPNPSCGDLQFERNESCRKCGTLKPRTAGGGIGRVPAATFEERPSRRPMPTPVAVQTPIVPLLQPAQMMAPGPYKEGDWICPNCGDHQFERNTACRRCQTVKPAFPARPMPPMLSPYIPMPTPMTIPRAAANPVLAVAPHAGGGVLGRWEQKGGPGGRDHGNDFKPGDWNCPSCGDHQFGRNDACRRCGTERPVLSTNKQPLRPGDWICPNPECGDIQFARNDNCRKCHTPRPAERERSRSPRQG